MRANLIVLGSFGSVWSQNVNTLSNLVGGCSNPTSPLTCKTKCGFQETDKNNYKLTFQGKDSLIIKYTGWEDGILSDTDIDSEYRFHVRLQKPCKAAVLDAIDTFKLKIDVMDYQVRYIREAVHRELCGEDSGLHLQFRRFRKNKDLISKGKDAFIMNIMGIMASGAKVGDIKKCFKAAKITLAKYNDKNKLYDYTKCEAYKFCDKETDWDEDDEQTTKPTTRTTTAKPPVTTGDTTPRTTTPGGTTTTRDVGTSEFSCQGPTCSIKMSDGTVFQGFVRQGVVEFRGVPYAMAPVGDMRWKAPVIKYDYEGATMDLKDYKPNCAQNKWDGVSDDQAEDCLFVNIYVSKDVLDDGVKVPIVYYIHGGGFNAGSARGGYSNLIKDQNVMVISIAYRLGIYGFLYVPDGEADQEFNGNWGILDQSAAMEWGKTFAPHFGGNPNQATINGCSAGSESIWWHLVTEKSWPFFNQAVTVGIGLNSAYDRDLGTALYDNVMNRAKCSTVSCLRTLSNSDIGAASEFAKDEVNHPIKPVLEPKFGPVVDGRLLVDQLINSVREGRLRKHTPISWNYAEHDAWGFARGAFKAVIEKVPPLADQLMEINQLMGQTGIRVPSDYTDQYFKAIYDDGNINEILDVFGCPSIGDEVVDCTEDFSRFLVSSAWACNSKWAIDGVLSSNDEYGPVYPMQFEYRNCEKGEDGEMTKTCHCAEGNFILGRKNIDQYEHDWQKDIAQAMRDAWGQFFREGTFPEGTLKDYRQLDGQFNIIDSKFYSRTVFENECKVLDNANNYLWDKNNF